MYEMFSAGCARNSNPSASFLRDFESELEHGTESGVRVSDTEPYCGRTSLKNPEWIYEDGETKNDDGSAVNAFRADFTDKVSIHIK